MGKQARRKSQQNRRAAVAASQLRGRSRNRFLSIGGFVIVGLVVAIIFVVANAGKDGPTGPVTPPANATADGAVTLGQADAPVTVKIYQDYMCPYCGRFDRANGTEIARLVETGTVRLELHLLSFLDEQSEGTRFSTRAANAAATVADRAPSALLPFNRLLYENQPEEGQEGLTDEQIATFAEQAGVPAEVVAAFGDRTFESWIATSTEAAFDSGVTGTPTVMIDGARFTGDLYTVGPLTAAITAAAAS